MEFEKTVITKRDTEDKNILYWKDVWQDLVESLLRATGSFRLTNPHILLLDLVDELRTSSFKNRSIELYFQHQLGYYCKHDPVVAKIMSADFAMVRRELGKKRYAYLLQLSNEVLKRFKNGEYRNVLHQHLVSLLISDGEPDAFVIHTGLCTKSPQIVRLFVQAEILHKRSPLFQARAWTDALHRCCDTAPLATPRLSVLSQSYPSQHPQTSP